MKGFINGSAGRLLLLLIGFAAGAGLFVFLGSSALSHSGVETKPATHVDRPLLNEFSTAFEDAASKVNPAIVAIYSEHVLKVEGPLAGGNDPLRQFFGDDFFRHFFGNQGPRTERTQALGSGVIVSDDGYILTNNHVVAHADKLTVLLQNKKRYTAKVVGTDPQSDVAVIKIDAHDLPAAALGNSDGLKVGQWVIAVGNPFGLMHTVTAGIISATGRSPEGLADFADFIQTDASINPGNSGGALADLDGNVVGINTAIESNTGNNAGVGFAIPINMAKSIMEELVKTGEVRRGYLGITLQDINDDLAKALKLGTTEGTLISDVAPDGPADKAGLKRGDIVTAFNGKKVDDSQALQNAVVESQPGSKVTLTYLRDGKEQEATVELGTRPKNLAVRGSAAPSESSASKKLGIDVQNLSSDLASRYGSAHEQGVVVTSVESGSAAEEAGIQKNDLIRQVDRKNVSNVEDFNRLMDEVKSGDTVAFLVQRGQSTFFVAIDVP